MDLKKYNYLDFESLYHYLRVFAGKNRESQPTKKKVNAIFRRLDYDANVKITFNEFAEAIKPIDVYFTELGQNKREEDQLLDSQRMSAQ